MIQDSVGFDNTILMFLKFGSEHDILDLYNNGTIFINPVQRFRLIEDNGLRGDKYEGVDNITNYLPGQFEIPSLGFKGNHLGIHLKESYENVYGNIYSLYCISSHGWADPSEFSIDAKIKDFGTHCLLIKDVARFIELLTKELKRIGCEYKHGFVEYYDKKLKNGSVSIFEKPLEFEYQKEFRFYVQRESLDPLVISIGTMEDYSEIHSSIAVVEGLKIKKNCH